jgi:hypothetical protein
LTDEGDERAALADLKQIKASGSARRIDDAASDIEARQSYKENLSAGSKKLTAFSWKQDVAARMIPARPLFGYVMDWLHIDAAPVGIADRRLLLILIVRSWSDHSDRTATETSRIDSTTTNQAHVNAIALWIAIVWACRIIARLRVAHHSAAKQKVSFNFIKSIPFSCQHIHLTNKYEDEKIVMRMSTDRIRVVKLLRPSTNLRMWWNMTLVRSALLFFQLTVNTSKRPPAGPATTTGCPIFGVESAPIQCKIVNYKDRCLLQKF